MEGFLMTGGAALPVDSSAAGTIFEGLARAGYDPKTYDFERVTPGQGSEIAALIIRACRSAGMTSRIAYAEPGGRTRPTPMAPRSGHRPQ